MQNGIKKRRHPRKSTNSLYNKCSVVRNTEKKQWIKIYNSLEYPPLKMRNEGSYYSIWAEI